jgi:hypothetical protein
MAHSDSDCDEKTMANIAEIDDMCQTMDEYTIKKDLQLMEEAVSQTGFFFCNTRKHYMQSGGSYDITFADLCERYSDKARTVVISYYKSAVKKPISTQADEKEMESYRWQLNHVQSSYDSNFDDFFLRMAIIIHDLSPTAKLALCDRHLTVGLVKSIFLQAVKDRVRGTLLMQ